MGSTYGVADFVGEDFGERSKWVWLDAHDRRNPGEKKVPEGADSGPGDIEIIFPVLARCIFMSVSGGNGAVRGVLEPGATSLSKGECLFVPFETLVARPADLLGKPYPWFVRVSLARRRPFLNS